MLESLGTTFTTHRFIDELEAMMNMDDDFVYGDNTSVQEYTDLLLDITSVAHKMHNHFRGGWLDTVLCLLSSPHIVKVMQNHHFLNQDEDFGNDDDIELRECIKEIGGLTKKQLLETIPQACSKVQSFMELWAAGKVVNEFLKEVEEQNRRLGMQAGEESV